MVFKESDAASTIVTSGTNLIGGIGRLNEEVIGSINVRHSYTPVKEVRVNQIQNYRFYNPNGQGYAVNPIGQGYSNSSNNQDTSNGQIGYNGFNYGSRFKNDSMVVQEIQVFTMLLRPYFEY
ncbi:hypothetical protein ACTFIZ_012916 [Dictyostelium cf. discoideum]